ncbi:MAG: RagB/SusD family nutrient uptake outer membrane protein, partial [Gillisia sp.]
MKTKEIYKILMCTLLVGSLGCTNLEIEQTDSVFKNQTGEFTGVDPAGSLTNLYNSLNGQIATQENLYALTEVTTNELLVPTRGTDWGDNGVWRTLESHTWDANHKFIKNTWNAFNQMIYNATAIIDDRSSPTDEQKAEAKFIRAYCMYQILDLFGQVPFRTPDEGGDVNPEVMSRSEALDFVMQDLNDALAVLPSSGPSADLNKPTKDAVRFLMARAYLNKHIFLGNDSPAAEDMNKVIELVDAIKADGYALQEGYFDIFKESVDSETIFFTKSDVGSKIWSALHYKQNTPDNTGGGWNGFSTLAEFYDLFEGDPEINEPGSGQEESRGFVPTDGSHYGIGYGFLIAQQYDETGTPMTDRVGNPLFFTRDFPGLLGNNEDTGIRPIKWHPENGAFTQHTVIFRYADAFLMK